MFQDYGQRCNDLIMMQTHPINSTTDAIIADFENSDSKIDETAIANGIDGMHHGRKSGPDNQQNTFQNRIKRKNQEIEHGIDPKKKMTLRTMK